jgi:hypothetical protein
MPYPTGPYRGLEPLECVVDFPRAFLIRLDRPKPFIDPGLRLVARLDAFDVMYRVADQGLKHTIAAGVPIGEHVGD